MKEIAVKMWELDVKEIFQLPDKTPVLILNTLFKDYKIAYAYQLTKFVSKLSKFHKFFTLDEPNFNTRSTKKSQSKRTK